MITNWAAYYSPHPIPYYLVQENKALEFEWTGNRRKSWENEQSSMAKVSSAHCQARDHQVQSWHLTSKYVSFIAFRLPQGKGLSVPDKSVRKNNFSPRGSRGGKGTTRKRQGSFYLPPGGSRGRVWPGQWEWKSCGRRWWRWFPYIYEGSNNA